MSTRSSNLDYNYSGRHITLNPDLIGEIQFFVFLFYLRNLRLYLLLELKDTSPRSLRFTHHVSRS